MLTMRITELGEVSDLAKKLQFFRGPKKTMPILSEAEPGWVTDEKKIYVGDGNKNIGIVTDEEFESAVTLESGGEVKVPEGMTGPFQIILTTDTERPEGHGVFGVQWDMSNPSPLLTRLTYETDPNRWVDTVILEEPVAAIGSEGGSSPFDNYLPWKGMEEYNIVDSETIYKQGDENFSRSQYDTMVWIPEFWYHIEQEGDIARYYISSDEREGFEKHPGSGRYVGRYTASEDYKSISGVASLVSITRATARENASAKGPGWSQYDYASYCAICLLYLVEYASFNSQEKIGNGVTSASAAVPSGGTDTMVYHTGRADGNAWQTAVQYRHIENPWGNLWQWVDGINMNNQEVWVCTDPSKYADNTTENYTNVGNRVELTDPNYGWITRMDVSTVFPWTFFPTASEGGSSVSYVCDYTYYAAGWRVLPVGGDWAGGTTAGLWYFYGDGAASRALVSLGLRLLHIPVGGPGE